MKAAVLGFVAGVLLAAPAVAQECFAGLPTRVSYADGRVITIIQRHDGDMTYTQPYAGFQDSVSKTHLMLFPKTARSGARATEYRWTTKLPKVGQLVPGYHFDAKGTMKSGDGKPLGYRTEGDVTAQDVMQIGACSYPVMVIKSTTYLGGQAISTATDYLSPEMMIMLRSDIVLTSAGTQIKQVVVAIE